MDASGVFNSCDTVATRSFFSRVSRICRRNRSAIHRANPDAAATASRPVSM